MKTLLKPAAAARFKEPETSIGDLEASVAAKVIAAAADVALVIGADDRIRDVAFGGDGWAGSGGEGWLLRPWVDTVTVESRPKIEALLRDARSDAAPRWRQVNHPQTGAADIPVLYSAVHVGPDGRVVAVGRDLRATAVLQQRLVDAQASMEREYSRLRHAETRYRLLFQISSEPVLIVDAGSHKVMEANPAAAELIGAPVPRIVGRFFADSFDADSGSAVSELLAKARTTGRVEDVPSAWAAGAGRPRLGLVVPPGQRLPPARPVAPVEAWASAIVVPKAKSRLLDVVESLPDGFVVTDLDQRVLTANTAFLDLSQLATEEQARGEPLGRWLGRSGVDLNVLVASLREHGSVRNFGTVLRGNTGRRRRSRYRRCPWRTASSPASDSRSAAPAAARPPFALRASCPGPWPR
jgi:transcriptional regulator PpsR